LPNRECPKSRRSFFASAPRATSVCDQRPACFTFLNGCARSRLCWRSSSRDSTCTWF
jgi:hypothetical protein